MDTNTVHNRSLVHAGASPLSTVTSRTAQLAAESSPQPAVCSTRALLFSVSLRSGKAIAISSHKHTCAMSTVRSGRRIHTFVSSG
jgi:hypothetical protein